ncbi:hypothetical protein E3P99_02513 [Wallemia hederae]|uniref:PHP domain-like protein n=1 Tax=Wallemia hederae TaxID=1540922 RepID=A0A4T0FJ97_9BASI|nr:hypothetical protein E3P99_02513 [Wallemia hederae]
MYADLNIPFIVTENDPARKTGKKDKKGKAPVAADGVDRDDAKMQWVGIESELRRSLETRTRTLIHLGYSVLCYEHYVKNFDASTHSSPFPKHRAVFPDLDTRSSNSARSILQLTRLTIELDEDGNSAKVLNQNMADTLKSYDILAVRVTGPNSFNHACLNMCTPSPIAAHIIQIDLARNTRLPFYLKRTTTGKAIADGAFFEVSYGAALDGNDEYGRRNLIAGVKEILRVTNGKGVIFTSGVKNALHLRSPGDVMNLPSRGTVFGMNQALAKKALVDNPKTVIKNGDSRRLFKGIFSDPVLHQSSTSSGASKRSNEDMSKPCTTPSHKKSKQ